MRNTTRAALIASGMLLAFLLMNGREARGEVRLSVGYGYGFSDKDKAQDAEVYGDSEYYFTREMGAMSEFRIRFSSKRSPVGFSIEFYKQKYRESYIELYQGIEQWRYADGDAFMYAGGSFDICLLPKSRLAPYVGAGLLKLLYFNFFGSGPPDYPRDFEVKIVAGARYRLGRRWNIDSGAGYFVGNRIFSVRLGLEYLL